MELFFDPHKFFKHDNIMFILLLRKGKRVYPYQLWMVEKNSIYIIT